MDEVWGYETEADPHTIEVHIGRIRERFKDNPDFEIVTMRGIGYKVVKNNGTKERKGLRIRSCLTGAIWLALVFQQSYLRYYLLFESFFNLPGSIPVLGWLLISIH